MGNRRNLKKVTGILCAGVLILSLSGCGSAYANEAGRQTETMTSEHVLEWDGEMYTKKGMAGVTVTGKKYLLMEHKGILTKKGAFAVKGSCSGVDAAQYVRYCSLVRGIKNEQ